MANLENSNSLGVGLTEKQLLKVFDRFIKRGIIFTDKVNVAELLGLYGQDIKLSEFLDSISKQTPDKKP